MVVDHPGEERAEDRKRQAVMLPVVEALFNLLRHHPLQVHQAKLIGTIDAGHPLVALLLEVPRLELLLELVHGRLWWIRQAFTQGHCPGQGRIEVFPGELAVDNRSVRRRLIRP